MEIQDRWAALQFDSAVAVVGSGIENALQEQYNAGSQKEPNWVRKYTIKQLLDPTFRLPAPPTEKESNQAMLDKLKTLKGVTVIKGG
jgi:hypothetical protein